MYHYLFHCLFHYLFHYLFHCLFDYLFHCLFDYLFHYLFHCLFHYLFYYLFHCLFHYLFHCLFHYLFPCLFQIAPRYCLAIKVLRKFFCKKGVSSLTENKCVITYREKKVKLKNSSVVDHFLLCYLVITCKSKTFLLDLKESFSIMRYQH